VPQLDQLTLRVVLANACSDLPRTACVAYGVIEMLMSVAVVAIMILSACGVQIGHESHAGCMNEPKHFECTMSMLPSNMSCGEEIKVPAKSGTCSAWMFCSGFQLQAASRKPFFIFEFSTEPSASLILMLHCWASRINEACGVIVMEAPLSISAKT